MNHEVTVEHLKDEQAILPEDRVDEADEGDAEEDLPDVFVVSDERSANWVVRKIVEARRYAMHVEAWAAGEIRRAQREEQRLLDRFGLQLEQWTAGASPREAGGGSPWRSPPAWSGSGWIPFTS